MDQASTVAESDVRAAVGVMLARTCDALKDAVGTDSIHAQARAALAHTLHAEDARYPGAVPPKASDGSIYAEGRIHVAVHDLFRSLGVDDGAITPNALRAQVLAALGFRELPAPAWLEGFRFFDSRRGRRGEHLTVVRVTPEGVVLQRDDGREDEPVPVGLFLAEHPVQPPRVDEKNAVYLSGERVGTLVSAEASVDYDAVMRAYEKTYEKAASALILGQSLTSAVKPVYDGAAALARDAAAKKEQPKPAPHQVWRLPPLGVDWYVGVLGDQSGTGPSLFNVAGVAINMVRAVEQGAECIGVQLRNGQRMLVGETWAYDGGVPFTILGVQGLERGVGWFSVEAHHVEGKRAGGMYFSSVLAGALDPARWRKVEEGTARYTGADISPFPLCDGCPGCHASPGARCLNFCPRLAEARAKATHECPRCPRCQCFGEYIGTTPWCLDCGLRLVEIQRLPSSEGLAALRAFADAIVTVTSSRDFRRRQIDEVLREDARRSPAFATARRAAVLAACEAETVRDGWEQQILADCHRYERVRGGGRTRSADAESTAACYRHLDAYERARGRV